MTANECLIKFTSIKECLADVLWMYFEIQSADSEQVVLVGKEDEFAEPTLEIVFMQPFMISCPMHFTYEGGDFIGLAPQEEFYQMNERYHIGQGYHIFKIKVENKRFFIIAKSMHVSIRE